MPLFKSYWIYADSREAVLETVTLTLMGSSIQWMLGIVAVKQLTVEDPNYTSEILQSGYQIGSVLLTVLDALLILWSVAFLIFLKKGIENRMVYYPFCCILSMRLMCEFVLAVDVFRSYFVYGQFTVVIFIKALIYALRTTMWIFGLLCVISRYQEITEFKLNIYANDPSQCANDAEEETFPRSCYVTDMDDKKALILRGESYC